MSDEQRRAGHASPPAGAEIVSVEVANSNVRAQLRIMELRDRVRLLIDHKRCAWAYRLTVEEARRLASLLLDAARDVAGEGSEGEGSEVAP